MQLYCDLYNLNKNISKIVNWLETEKGQEFIQTNSLNMSKLAIDNKINYDILKSY